MNTNLTDKGSVLVLAARRPNQVEPLAEEGKVSHKCMLPIHGEIMLERVIAALLESACFQHVYVSIDEASVLQGGARLRKWMKQGLVSALAACGNLADSVVLAAEKIPDKHWPLMITTADNALHTPEIIHDFVEDSRRIPCDVSVGVTREADVVAEIPDSGLNWHRLRDGGFSSCNLYLLFNRSAIKTVEIFRNGGQWGKKHWRILKSFGVMPFILYKLKCTDTESIFRRLGKRMGLYIRPVFLPYYYGPIDVDNPKTFLLSEKILAARE